MRKLTSDCSTSPHASMFTKQSGRGWTTLLTAGLGQPKRYSPISAVAMAYRVELRLLSKCTLAFCRERVLLSTTRLRREGDCYRLRQSDRDSVADLHALQRFRIRHVDVFG